jgi:Family of unknown function (DUF6152)
MRPAAALFYLALVSGSAAAHHSTAEYDRSTLRELEGELTEVRWRNPHVMVKLRIQNAAGAAEDWELAGLPISLLEGAGLTGSLFSAAVGQRVKAAGWPSRTRASMLVSNILLPSGDEALFYPQSKLRWSTRQAGGQWARESVSGQQRDLFRVWSVADLGAYVRMAQAVAVKLTPAAQAKMVTPPRLDVCRPQGMPGIMLNPLPIQFIDRGDHIDLRLASFGVLRTIDMTVRQDAASIPLSDLGHSAGRWVGDTLEVRTTRVGWPYVDDDGRPQSTNVEILERFAPAPDGKRVTYTQTVTDTASFVEPLTAIWDVVDAGDTIEPVGCE